jgi:DHA2 family multidrug resistance protein
MAAAQFPALTEIYGQLQRQAMMLAYKNAFAILAGTVALLSPLVWVMRLPPKTAKVDPEQMAAH